MTCNHLASGVIVCSTPSTEYRRIHRCPICKTRRRMLRTFGGWYGDHVTCLGCGNQWDDGYRHKPSRSPRKRAAQLAAARSRWATARPASEYRAAMDEFAAIYLTPEAPR